MRKLLLMAILGVAALAIPSSTVAAENHPAKRFAAELSGANENPPNDSQASGEASLRVVRHETAVRYRLEINDIQNVSVAHIHLGAAGVNGPVVVFLYGPVSPPVSGDVEVRGRFTEADFVGPMKGRPMADLLAAIRGGGAYVNAHTTAHPAGEIRGQIVIEEEDDD
jgi:hypothetical protein